MGNAQKSKGGYIGLLGLLITIALVTVLMWRSDLFGSDTKKQTSIEKDQTALKETEELKAKLERQSAQTNEQL